MYNFRRLSIIDFDKPHQYTQQGSTTEHFVSASYVAEHVVLMYGVY